MARNKQHDGRISEIEGWLTSSSNASFYDIATRQDGKSLTEWCARLLSSLAVMTTGQQIRYVAGSGDRDAAKARLVVFTDELCVRADIDDVFNPNSSAVPRAFARNALQSIAVASTARSDERNPRADQEWPALLGVQLSYHGAPVTFSGEPYSEPEGSMWNLLDALRQDLVAK